MGISGFKLGLPVIFSIFVLGAIGSTENAFAVDVTSVGSGPWTSPATWDLGVPTAADRAIIAAGDTVDVTGIVLADIVQVKGTLTINPGPNFVITTTGDFTVTGSGTANNDGFGVITDDLRVDGGIFNNNAAGTLAVTNNLQVYNGATFNNFGAVTADEMFVYDAGTTFNNDGSVGLSNLIYTGAFAGVSGPAVFNNNPTGTVTGSGITGSGQFVVFFGSTWNNAGSLVWDSTSGGQGLSTMGTFVNTATGTATATGGAPWVVSNTATFSNACGGVFSTDDDFIVGLTTTGNMGSLTIGGDLNLVNVQAVFVNDGVTTIGGAITGLGTYTDNGNSCGVAGPITAGALGLDGNSAAASAKPTLGKAKTGVMAVEGGFCFNLYCVDVTEYFTHFDLQQVNSDESFTITLTGFFPAGADRANYASIAAAPTGGDINTSSWNIMAQRVGATDQWELTIVDPNGNLGAVTVSVQKVDNNVVSFAFTIQSHTPSSFGEVAGQTEPADNNQILATEIRDNRGNSVRNLFNDGFLVNDVYAYPEVQANFESPLDVEKLCLNEDSTNRNTCAFDKVKDWTISQAEQTLAEMYGENYQGDFDESEQHES